MEDLDADAQRLLGEGASPIDAIKAIRDRHDISLAEAKTVVHRNLSPERQRAAEHLWDELIDLIDSTDESLGKDPPSS
jgi:ribosomal protein L7/L12